MAVSVGVFGEALFDMIQQPNGSYTPYVGGSPFNVARSFARQQLDCHYLSPISTDLLGEQIYQSVLAHQIGFTPANRSPRTTSLALVYTNEDGQPDYRLYREGVADLDINAERLMDYIPDDLDLFHTGSLALVPEMVDVLIPVIRQLKERGVKISIDINVRKGVKIDHDHYVAAIWRFVEYADIIKVSDEDLHLKGLTGDPEQHVMTLLDRMEDGLVALTFGDKGSHLYSNDMHIEEPVYPIRTLGDTVGAGDTFFSALVSQLMRDRALSPRADLARLAYALRFGSCAAALNVEKTGCQPPTYEEVEAELGS